jgi:hypothetical protein
MTSEILWERGRGFAGRGPRARTYEAGPAGRPHDTKGWPPPGDEPPGPHRAWTPPGRPGTTREDETLD